MSKPMMSMKDMLFLRETVSQHLNELKAMLEGPENISVNLVMWDKTDENGVLFLGEAETSEVIRRLQHAENDSDTVEIPAEYRGGMQ